MSEIHLGIDFGISKTKVVSKKINKPVSSLLVPYKLFCETYQTSRIGELEPFVFDVIEKHSKSNLSFKKIGVTGGKHTTLPDEINNIKIIKKNEIDAIADGAKKVSGKSANFLVLSCGSGTAFVAVKDGKNIHLGGTGLGGGTILGLSSLIINEDDPEKINTLSILGSNKADLILKDVISGPIGNLPEDATAVHFGNLKELQKLSDSDLSKSIINLVAINISRLASATAISAGLNKLVIIGGTSHFDLFIEQLTKWVKLSGLEVEVLENSEFVTSIGVLD